VGLWGIGGLGVHAVQIARMAGAAPIIAVDPSKAARVRALDRGADVALDPGGTDVVADVLRLSDGGLDLAVDLVGANAVLTEAAACLGRFGRVVMVGLSMDPLQLGPGVVLGMRSQSVLGHLGYQKRHLDDLVKLVGAGRLELSRSISGTLPLDDVAAGVRQVGLDGRDQVRDGVEHPATQGFVREVAKPSLHQVEPGTGGRGEVPVEARVGGQPAPDVGVLVRGVVVQDQVDVQTLWGLPVDGLEETSRTRRGDAEVGTIRPRRR